MIARSPLLRSASILDTTNICKKCLLKLRRVHQVEHGRRTFLLSRTLHVEFFGSNPITSSKSFQTDYFSSYEPRRRLMLRNGTLTSLSNSEVQTRSTLSTNAIWDAARVSTNPVTDTDLQQELPHRRGARLKEVAESQSTEQAIPPDASARLSAISSALPTTSLRRKIAAYLALSKPRLSFLILLSTTSAYGLYPISSLLTLDPSMTQLPTLSISTLTFLYLTTGTFLSCSSANALNMILEPKYDAQMSRTRNRPLVRGLISRRSAVLFAIATGAAGVSLLYMGTNPTVAALSAANICIYAFAYTPLKRIHVINTWVGAIVGAIPPMMGWVAAAGQIAPTGHDTWRDMLFSEDSIGGWIIAGMLFAWQFPHFNSLSHIIREEYKAAGHQMMCWVNPARNARVALRYSLLMFPLCFGFYWIGIVNEGFLVSSTIANGWLAREAYRFWRHQGAKGTARSLFWASVWQLPILLVGGLVTKRGVWDGVSRRIFGVPDLDDDGDDEWYEGNGELGSDTLISPPAPSSPKVALSVN